MGVEQKLNSAEQTPDRVVRSPQSSEPRTATEPSQSPAVSRTGLFLRRGAKAKLAKTAMFGQWLASW